MTVATRNLILIVGDQLSRSIASLAASDLRRDRILMVEVMEEATYVHHHKKKIAFLFSAMRHFADGLRSLGWAVDYVKLDDDHNTGTFGDEMARAVTRLKPERIVVTEPGEWRVREMIGTWAERFNVPVDMLEDDRFVCSHEAFANWAKSRKQLRMEYFYRDMRKQTGLLMDGDHPVGGKWNFDTDNRKPAKADLFMPEPFRVEPDEITQEVLDLVETRFPRHIGTLRPFWFGVTAADAERALEHFITEALPRFGDYQDAMLEGERFLYHSVLSLYINAGLLDALTVCRRVETAWKNGDVPLNAAEGFIRQIIGWREYVRGIYWLKMPDYIESNVLGAKRDLPSFYWTGETGMACLKAAITQTIDEGYAHHIQRLMLTGNFAMLVGVDPRQVHEWYLAVYVDAYEWVELPNTLGMSQFADGGVLGSKPYAAGGNYINRMSDHCSACRYDVNRKTDAKACPFNALYWDFLVRNRRKLSGNSRLKLVYATWDRMGKDQQRAYRDSAAAFLKSLDEV